MRLHRDDIDAIVERVVERLSVDRRPRSRIGFASAAEVAALYGVTPSWVYANKKRLGAVKLGDGPKARLRFDLEQVEEALRPRGASKPRPRHRTRRGRPRKNALPAGVELLKGRSPR